MQTRWTSACQCLLAAGLIGTGSAAAAQDGAADASAPGESAKAHVIVVKGLAPALEPDDLPWSTDVIGESTLEERQVRSVRQALQDVPNTSVREVPARLAVGAASSAFARDGNTGINIRGLGGNRVLMLVDGIRLPRSYVSRSAIFDREYLALDLIKRIEIQRGPVSAIHGSDGLAGVVDFITYDPIDFLHAAGGAPRKTVGGRVGLAWDGDDNGLTLGGAVAGSASDSVRWMLIGTQRRAHALDNRGSNGEPNANRTRPNPQRDRNPALLGKVVIEPSAAQRHVITLEHGERHSDIDLLSSRAVSPSRANDVLFEDTAFSSRRSRFTWDGRFNLNAAAADSVRAIVAYQRAGSRRWGNSFLFDGMHRIRDNSYSERIWQLGLRAEKVLAWGAWTHRLTYGVEHTRNQIGNLFDGQAPLPPETLPLKRFPDTRESLTGVYLQDESTWGDWVVTPGVRFDRFDVKVTSQEGYYPPARQPGQSRSGSGVSPKLGVLYRATPTWSVYGHYASGYRPPEAGQLNDRFEAIAPPNTLVIIQPNPNLRAEKSRGLEVGLRGRAERWSLDVAAFSNRFSNLIVDAELVEEVGNQRLFQAVNINRARIHGLEAKGAYDWGLVAGGRLASTFGFGMAKGRNRGSGKPLNSIDPALLALGLKYDWGAFSFYAEGRHHAAKKERDIDTEAILNARVGTQFATPSATVFDAGLQWRPRKDIRVNFAVHNIANRKYWLWPDVYGVASNSPIKSAYTRPGRSAHVAVTMDF